MKLKDKFFSLSGLITRNTFNLEAEAYRRDSGKEQGTLLTSESESESAGRRSFSVASLD